MQIAELIRKLEQFKELEATMARLEEWMAAMPPMPDPATLEAAANAAAKAAEAMQSPAVTAAARALGDQASELAEAAEVLAKFDGLSRLEVVVGALNESRLSTIADLAEFLREDGYPIDKKAVSNALYRAEKAGKASRIGKTSDGRIMWRPAGRTTTGGED